MKHFAKSLVSLVIALTILATMCVVGFSASAKVNEFVLVSATATKDKTDLTATKDDSGVFETVDVVDTSTLGAPAGAPDTAYKFTFANSKDGVHFTAPSNDASALGGKTTELVFDAWVYVSDLSKAGNLIFRMYGSVGPTLGGSGYIESYVWQALQSYTEMGYKTGWNHIQVPMSFYNGWQGADGAPMTAYKADMKITGISLHDHGTPGAAYDVAVAAIKLVYKDVSVDTNKVGTTLVSAVDEKNLYDVKPATKANISIVSTADLKGGTAGVPSAQAYKSESAWQDGIVFPVNISNETAADIKANGAYLDAWVHITDATTVNNFVFRFFKKGARNGIGGNLSFQLTSQSNGFGDPKIWKAGWYHFVWKIGAGTDLTGVVEMTAHDHGNIPGYGTSSSFSVAAVRIVPTAADAQKSWDGREYLVGAISPNEAGVDVGNWEAAEYEGGYGAFTNSSGVVKFRKNLPESHDLSGKLVVAWLYTSSTNINAASEFELCTVSNDNREFTFNLKALDLKVGWNKVILDVNHKNGSGNPAGTAGYSGKNTTGGEPDASNINFIRVYEHNIADFKVGAMYVTDYGAVSNGTFYDTAEEAFDNARADDTVTLHGDAAVESVMLNKGIDLELNGNTLTADYFVSFKDSEVADSSADKAGRLAVASENLVLNAENAQLPVVSEDGKGYAFFSANMQQVAPVADENSVTLTFKPSIGAAFNAAWFGDGAADNGLKLGVRLTYKSQYAYDGGNATGTVSDTFVFDDAHVASIYTKGTAMKITITGIADVSDLTIASVVVSGLGFECVGEVVSVAAVQ